MMPNSMHMSWFQHNNNHTNAYKLHFRQTKPGTHCFWTEKKYMTWDNIDTGLHGLKHAARYKF